MKIKNSFQKDKNIILILGLIYLLITILATISYVAYLNRVSTTIASFGNVISGIWWQLLMITLFAVIYILYNSKPRYAAFLELIMGLAMFVYVVMSSIVMGTNLLAIIFELIYPIILTIHGYSTMKMKKSKVNRSIIRRNKKIKSTI